MGKGKREEADRHADENDEEKMSTERDEQARLERLLEAGGVKRDRIEALGAVIENTEWLRAKLEETREMIGMTAVAIPYDNGGGQAGIRENPLYKGYHALWKSYLAGMGKLFDYLPDEKAKVEEEEKNDNVLTIMRAKRRKA